MPRASRLLSLMDVLRRRRRPITAAELAEALGVSVRTVYRDVATLQALGAPVDGEAGLGYLLQGSFFLPPLMFDETELEALVLGARFVERQPDRELAEAALSALAKIATCSDDLRARLDETGLVTVPTWSASSTAADLKPLREAIRREHKLKVSYEAYGGAASTRVIWPIALAFYHGTQTIAAWCELRGDFRHFRVDRLRAMEDTGEVYPTRRALLMARWRERWEGDEGS